MSPIFNGLRNLVGQFFTKPLLGKMSRVLVCHCALFLLSMTFVHGVSEGVFDKIKAGIQNAKNYLETAREIADLVAKSLTPKQPEKERGDSADFFGENMSGKPTNLVSTFFHLLGLDSKKVTAVAVNSFIFFAQMISELFQIKPKIQDGKGDSLDPLQLIVSSENEKVQNLLKQAQDEKLPNQLIENIDGYDSSCIKLLMCKITPIIWALQKSLKNGSLHNKRDITSWLPSKEDFEDYADSCETKYNDCKLEFN